MGTRRRKKQAGRPDHDEGKQHHRWSGDSRHSELVPLAPGAMTQLGKIDNCALLRESATAGNEALTEKLLDAGAHVDARDAEGNTALMLASRNGHVDVVRILLRGGADPGARNNKGDSALCWTTDGGCMELCDEETARVLKAFGAD